ncbi:MAG: hypothetical protein IJ001_12715 [Oscillospiraceae bacterium]|nr:hypothetical protein [Oscillospiraceae bacterium]MBQ8835767.1 hypothetical protein [Oscillospiraceae bacterium]
MTKKQLYLLWGVLFIICAGLGFIPEPEGAVRIFLTVLSVAFFLPPAVLVYRAMKEHDRAELMLVRNLSAASLGLTLVTLVLNVAAAMSSETLGNILHTVLVVVSTPMICSNFWFLSLFLWACLLMVTLQQRK